MVGVTAQFFIEWTRILANSETIQKRVWEINRDLSEADFWPGVISGLPVRTKPLARRTLPRG
jgi:hypothetical protein